MKAQDFFLWSQTCGESWWRQVCFVTYNYICFLLLVILEYTAHEKVFIFLLCHHADFY